MGVENGADRLTRSDLGGDIHNDIMASRGRKAQPFFLNLKRGGTGDIRTALPSTIYGEAEAWNSLGLA